MNACKIDYVENILDLKSFVSIEISECEVWAAIVSSWHFDNLLALMELKQLNNVCCIIIPEISRAGDMNFRLTPEMLVNGINERFRRVIFLSIPLKNSVFDIFHTFFRGRNKAVYINPGLRPNLKLLFTLSIFPSTFYAIDEGLGTYISVEEFKKSVFDENSKNRLVEFIKEIIICLMNLLLFQKKEKFYLFDKQKNGELTVNLNISHYLRNRFFKCANHERSTLKYTIFILVDNSLVVSHSNILSFFEKILSILPPQYSIYIKTHPNDASIVFDKLAVKYSNIKIIDSFEGAEVSIAKYNPQLLIGGYSTSLFASSAIFGIKAISYMGLYSTEIPISLEYNNQINYFLKSFQNSTLIDFPHTSVEFLSKLKYLIHEK